MVIKKTHQKTTKGKTQTKARIIYEGKPAKMGWIIPAVIIILIILLAGIAWKTNILPFGDKTDITEENVLVMVNGDPIYLSELDLQWNVLPPQTKLTYTRDQLLEELVQERLLLQKAEEIDLIVSDEEVNAFIKEQQTLANITDEQLEEMFATQGTSLEEMKIVYKKQLSIAKLFDSIMEGALNATDEEIAKYYTENLESFYKPEQVRVQHILVEVNEAVNETQAQERVDSILAELDAQDNKNFCEMVSNYSADFGSVDNCGEYTFGKGMMVPEFEEAGFAMKAGERDVIQTDYGYHIMLKKEDIAPGYLLLEDKVAEITGEPTLKEVIEQILIEAKAKELFDTYVGELLENAEIVYTETEEAGENETIAEEEEELPVTITVSQEETPETNPEEEVTQDTEEQSQENNSTGAEA